MRVSQGTWQDTLSGTTVMLICYVQFLFIAVLSNTTCGRCCLSNGSNRAGYCIGSRTTAVSWNLSDTEAGMFIIFICIINSQKLGYQFPRSPILQWTMPWCVGSKRLIGCVMTISKYIIILYFFGDHLWYKNFSAYFVCLWLLHIFQP